MFRENTVSDWLFDKEISMGVNHGPDLISHPSRNTASLNWRGKRWDKMKAGCQTSQILQDLTIELFGCDHTLFFKTRERTTLQEDSEIIRLPFPPQTLSTWAQRGQGFPNLGFKGWDHCLTELCGWGPPRVVGTRPQPGTAAESGLLPQ